jgi:hypothetical protein
VRGHDHEQTEAVSRQALRLVNRDLGQGAGTKRDRAGEINVLLGAADAYGRREHCAKSSGHVPPDGIGQHRVGTNRQMPAVMLDRAKRYDRDRYAAVDQPAQLRCPESLELVHSNKLSRAQKHHLAGATNGSPAFERARRRGSVSGRPAPGIPSLRGRCLRAGVALSPASTARATGHRPRDDRRTRLSVPRYLRPDNGSVASLPG